MCECVDCLHQGTMTPKPRKPPFHHSLTWMMVFPPQVPLSSITLATCGWQTCLSSWQTTPFMASSTNLAKLSMSGTTGRTLGRKLFKELSRQPPWKSWLGLLMQHLISTATGTPCGNTTWLLLRLFNSSFLKAFWCLLDGFTQMSLYFLVRCRGLGGPWITAWK